MKKNLLLVALMTVLVMMTVGCQKEKFKETETTVKQNSELRIVDYTIDKTVYHTILYTEAQWEEFLNNMITLSEQGHEVCFVKNSVVTMDSAAKDYLTTTATTRQEAKAWAEMKVNEGYTVAISYNSNTGKYTCIAYK